MRVQYSKIRFARSSRVRLLGASILVAVPLAASAASAQSESVIYSFPSHSAPQSRPFEDPTGAFFVTTTGYRGVIDTAVKISENHGVWKNHKIFSFKAAGAKKLIAGLIADPNGVLYGVAQSGGAYGHGSVYSLTQSGGRWTEAVLHNFTGGADGGRPVINLAIDKATGTLFGTTPTGGGQSGCGTAFSLVPSGGNWTFSTLYSFAGGSDGCKPATAIHGGAKKGTYFSTTYSGGVSGAGTVFELAEKNGVWSESVIYSFTGGSDGNTPEDIDINPDTGLMYGVTALGGAQGHGVVYELSQNGQIWTQSVLYSFTGGADGDLPIGLHLEKSGALYGTTQLGGSALRGTLFELVNSGTSWSESVLYNFGTSESDGSHPQSRPVEDPNTGILYGTTADGGAFGGGALYEFVP